MNNLQHFMENYIEYCRTQKRLDTKTLKAYTTDLKQFTEQLSITDISNITPAIIENYIAFLHKKYHSKTVKRKIASLKAFFHFLEYKDLLSINPFNKIQLHFREPVKLPRTIPLYTIETFLSTIYTYQKNAKTVYQRRNALRDAAVIELLFSSGMRISELCALQPHHINLYDGTILIHGKRNKERRIQIANSSVIHILNEYQDNFYNEIAKCNYFFVSQKGTPLTDQTVRRTINKYTSLAAINMHITPHMFRHTFATSLLEADVDIRYIQEMLGHSSINITEIYTHVAVAKQRDILLHKHPRKDFKI